MSPFELWNLILVAIALGVSALSLVRSERAVRLSKQANQIASQQLQQTALANSPTLIFSVTSAFTHPTPFTITVHIFNAGSHPTQIVEGQISLYLNEYPEGDQFRPLAGVKIAGRSEHVEEFKTRATVINRTWPQKAAAKIVCKAVYTRPNEDNATEEQSYVYDSAHAQFIRNN